MAVLKGPWNGRRPSAFGRSFYLRVQNGQMVVCKWPRPRSKPLHPRTQEMNSWFTQANKLAKLAPDRQQEIARRASEGTNLMPRDLLIAAMAGRLYTLQLTDGTEIYPMGAYRDLTKTFDIIGSEPGTMFARNGDLWVPIVPTAPGQVPVSQGPGEAPEWQNVGTPTGAWTVLHDDTLTAGLAANVYKGYALPTGWRRLDIDFYIPNSGTSLAPRVRVNGDSGSNYWMSLQDSRPSGSAGSADYAGQTAIRMVRDPWSPIPGTIFATLRVIQSPTSSSTYFNGDLFASNRHLSQWGALYAPGGTTPITQISFASAGVDGLTVNTRIQIRASVV